MSNIYITNEKKILGIKNLDFLELIFFKRDIDFSIFSYLIFTSKNAIKALDSYCISWKKIPCLCISSQTSKTLEKHGGKLALDAKAKNAKDFAEKIKNKLKSGIKNKKVLYLRANKIATNLKILLESNVDFHEEIIYESKLKKDYKKVIFDKNDIVIFTSALRVKYFFKLYKWRSDMLAICIGEHTKSVLKKDVKFKLSLEPSFASCIEMAKKYQI